MGELGVGWESCKRKPVWNLYLNKIANHVACPPLEVSIGQLTVTENMATKKIVWKKQLGTHKTNFIFLIRFGPRRWCIGWYLKERNKTMFQCSTDWMLGLLNLLEIPKKDMFIVKRREHPICIIYWAVFYKRKDRFGPKKSQRKPKSLFIVLESLAHSFSPLPHQVA